MAWIVFALDGTLLQQQPGALDDTMTGDTDQMQTDPAQEGVEPPMMSMPTEGAVEAVVQLMNEGHRVSVWTDRFAPMPEQRKEQLRQEIEQELLQAGFPEMEVWTGTTKPAADIYIDRKAVTYDDDWGLALAQVEQMLVDQGMAGGIDDGSLAMTNGYQDEQSPEQPQAEEQQEAPAPKKAPKR